VSEPTYRIEVKYNPRYDWWLATAFRLSDDSHAFTGGGRTDDEAVADLRGKLERAVLPSPARTIYADEDGKLVPAPESRLHSVKV
jgi:hypothetical protein